MRTLGMVVMAALMAIAFGGKPAQAQATLPTGFQSALALGDTATLSRFLAAAMGDQNMRQSMADALLDAALGLKQTNPILSSLYAALACSTGHLQPGRAEVAINLAGLVPGAVPVSVRTGLCQAALPPPAPDRPMGGSVTSPSSAPIAENARQSFGSPN